MPGLAQRVALRMQGDGATDARWCADVDFMEQHWKELPDDPDHYSCDRFDPTTRLCTDQEGKPPVCRDYPWYRRGAKGREDYARGLPSRCSYLLDVAPGKRPEGARPLIPIEVLA
jgi:hypothetical protein